MGVGLCVAVDDFSPDAELGMEFLGLGALVWHDGQPLAVGQLGDGIVNGHSGRKAEGGDVLLKAGTAFGHGQAVGVRGVED